MTMIREEVLRRVSTDDERAGPELLKVVVWAHLGEEAGQKSYELRGEDMEGRIHFSFKDSRRMVVLGEFDVTMSDLKKKYITVGKAAN